MRLIFVAVLLAGCGSVSTSTSDGAPDPQGNGGAGGASSGTGGSDVAGGRSGSNVAGGSGGPSSGGAGGASSGGVSNAPTCATEFAGAEAFCKQIPDPADPTNPNAGWGCDKNCRDVAGAPLLGCVYKGVTYCVSSCSDCY